MRGQFFSSAQVAGRRRIDAGEHEAFYGDQYAARESVRSGRIIWVVWTSPWSVPVFPREAGGKWLRQFSATTGAAGGSAGEFRVNNRTTISQQMQPSSPRYGREPVRS